VFPVTDLSDFCLREELCGQQYTKMTVTDLHSERIAVKNAFGSFVCIVTLYLLLIVQEVILNADMPKTWFLNMQPTNVFERSAYIFC
jgi:hypothetical protein